MVAFVQSLQQTPNCAEAERRHASPPRDEAVAGARLAHDAARLQRFPAQGKIISVP